MTTLPITMEQSAEHDVRIPAGWWLLPSILAGTGIWVAGLTALFL
jgi:hypothetical protein